MAMGDDGEPVLGIQGVRIEPAGALESCPGIVEMIPGKLDAAAKDLETGRGWFFFERPQVSRRDEIIAERKVSFGGGLQSTPVLGRV